VLGVFSEKTGETQEDFCTVVLQQSFMTVVCKAIISIPSACTKVSIEPNKISTLDDVKLTMWIGTTYRAISDRTMQASQLAITSTVTHYFTQLPARDSYRSQHQWHRDNS